MPSMCLKFRVRCVGKYMNRGYTIRTTVMSAHSSRADPEKHQKAKILH